MIPKILDKFSELNILVIGDVMLDVYNYHVTKHSRVLVSERPGIRAYCATQSIRRLGGAGNVAANLAALDVQTSVIGVAGNDDGYFCLCEIADRLRIRHMFIRDPSRPTTTKSRLHIDDRYVLRTDNESVTKVGREIEALVLRDVVRAIPGVDAVVLSDYAKGLFTKTLVQHIIQASKRHSIPVIADFKPVNRKLFSSADIVSPNEHEARQLLRSFSRFDIKKSMSNLHARLSCAALVVTLGDYGIAGYDHHGFFHIPAHMVTVRDAVGCGDTVRAGLAIGCAMGLSLRDSAALGNYAAAVVVQKPHTAVVSRTELRTFISQVLSGAKMSEAH